MWVWAPVIFLWHKYMQLTIGLHSVGVLIVVAHAHAFECDLFGKCSARNVSTNTHAHEHTQRNMERSTAQSKPKHSRRSNIVKSISLLFVVVQTHNKVKCIICLTKHEKMLFQWYFVALFDWFCFVFIDMHAIVTTLHKHIWKEKGISRRTFQAHCA